MIRFDAVTKQYPDGTVAVDELDAHRAHGQDHRARRPVGLRQDHQPADGQPDDRADPRRDHARRPGHRADGRGRAAPRHRATSSSTPGSSRTAPCSTTSPPCRGCSAGTSKRTREPVAASCSSGSAWRPSSAGATRHQLSGGQQQRVGVARALAADPPVMLMDEPFSAVDPVVREQLQDEFLRLQAELGKTIVFVTHDIDEAIKLGDQVAVLRVGGRLAQVAEPAYLLAHPADDFVADFVGRDRGYRALGFQDAPRLPLRSEPTVRARRDVRDRAGCRRGSSWSTTTGVRSAGSSRPASATGRSAEADLHRGGTVAREHGSLRGALDAALSSPSRRGVIVDDGGVLCGTVLAAEVLTAIEDTERPERDEADPVHGGARPSERVRARRDLARRQLAHGARRSPATQPLPGGGPAGHRARRVDPAGLGRQPLVAVVPGDHHDDRAALHDPVAGAVRPHAARARHQDPRPGQRHRRDDDLHRGAARAHRRRRARRGARRHRAGGDRHGLQGVRRLFGGRAAARRPRSSPRGCGSPRSATSASSASPRSSASASSATCSSTATTGSSGASWSPASWRASLLALVFDAVIVLGTRARDAVAAGAGGRA